MKIRTKVNIKIKLNQILRGEIEEKNIQNKIYSIKNLMIKFVIISK
jgi:hypothetical protein